MRIAVAEISQETDTFSPIPTELGHFEQYGLYFGDEILKRMPGVGKIGGLLAVADGEEDVELLPIMRAQSTPGGRVTAEALDFFEEKLVSGLQGILPVDGFFLSLHGAASSATIDDLEGHLLNAVRTVVGDAVPIVVPLDHHANVTERIMALSDVVIGYQTQPHDKFEAGERGARILFDLVRGKISPTVGWHKIPMITPQDQFLTSGGPMKAWFDLAREMEKRPGVISASNFPMQPWLDVEEGGWTAMVYTDNDLELAQRLATELADKAWELRAEFWASERVSPEEAIRQADQAAEGLIILSDTGDSVAGGAPGDSTCLLKEMLRQRISSTALVPMVDPEAVGAAAEAGVGSEVTLSVGGKWDDVFSQPVEVRAKVTGVSSGLVVKLGTRGYPDLGRTVLLEVGNIKLVLAESRMTAINYPIMYMQFGLDIADAKMVVVKTASNFQYFAKWRKDLIRVDSPGMTQSTLQDFEWVRVPRPLYPLDELPEWRAARAA